MSTFLAVSAVRLNARWEGVLSCDIYSAVLSRNRAIMLRVQKHGSVVSKLDFRVNTAADFCDFPISSQTDACTCMCLS